MDRNDPLQAYRAATATDAPRFAKTVGYVVDSDGERIVIHLDVRDKHLNAYGAAHGGVALTMLDTAGGVQVYAAVRPRRMATINLAAQFVDAVPLGPIVATARIDRLGKTVAHAAMELRAEHPQGRLLATAVGSYRLYREDG